METTPGWPDNPLPILPAAYKLGLPPPAVSNAQVFQNAACNWRCWYCYVPYNLLAANESRSGWLTAEDLVDSYWAEQNRPLVIDCSGGQPDLVPEWIPWMMRALRAKKLDTSVYLWSDDNLSNDFFWRHLSAEEIKLVASYANYGRVCCFKGYNQESFAFNTRADPTLFVQQFSLFERLAALNVDLYAYATFTASDDKGLATDMAAFADRLQEIHYNLPLRLVPLRIEAFGVVEPRVKDIHRRAMKIQDEAVQAWAYELSQRFSEESLLAPMPTVSTRD